MSDFSDREMYEQAAGNVVAFVSAADGFLRDRGIDPAKFHRYFGEMAAPGWDDIAGDIDATARAVALNMTSRGFETTTVKENGTVTVHSRWTEQHADSDWPTSVKPALEKAAPVLFQAAMDHLGVQMTASMAPDGVDLRLAPRGGN